MKLIKPSYSIVEQQSGLEGIYKMIEQAGKTCYKSEHTIKEGSAKPFVDRMINLGHCAVLEHSTIYLYYTTPRKAWRNDKELDGRYSNNPYSKVVYNYNKETENHEFYITSNMRVLVENNWLDDLKYLCEPTEYHEKRICVRFICDRGILAEFTRHRKFSFCAESSRYCNYSKDKFNNECTFILPSWVTTKCPSTNNNDGPTVADIEWSNSMREAEKYYFKLLELGWKPEQARAVLPNSLKTELVMTGFVSDWEHFFDLRDSSLAHPQARELASPLHKEFNNRF